MEPPTKKQTTYGTLVVAGTQERGVTVTQAGALVLGPEEHQTTLQGPRNGPHPHTTSYTEP
jgi:hypothetical protein